MTSMATELRQIGRRLDVLMARARLAEARLRGRSSLAQLRRLKLRHAQAKLALGRLARRLRAG